MLISTIKDILCLPQTVFDSPEKIEQGIVLLITKVNDDGLTYEVEVKNIDIRGMFTLRWLAAPRQIRMD